MPACGIGDTRRSLNAQTSASTRWGEDAGEDAGETPAVHPAVHGTSRVKAHIWSSRMGNAPRWRTAEFRGPHFLGRRQGDRRADGQSGVVCRGLMQDALLFGVAR